MRNDAMRNEGVVEQFIEDLDDEDDSQCIKEYLEKQKLMKELADDRGRSYEAIKKSLAKLTRLLALKLNSCYYSI